MMSSNSSISRIFILIGYSIPILLLVWFIVLYGINIPYWEQYCNLPLFKKIALGNASIQDFWYYSLHQEHRQFLPLIFFTIPLAFWFNWNTKISIFIIIFLTIITFTLICYLASKQNNNDWKKIHIGNILSGFLLFSIIQYEGLLESVTELPFAILWFVVCLFYLSYGQGKLKIRFAIALLALVIAAFSFGSGLFFWIAALPSLILFCNNLPNKIQKYYYLTWFGVYFLTIYVYFLGYRQPPYHHNGIFILSYPKVAVNYFFTYLGASLSTFGSSTRFLGIVSFLGFLTLVALILKQNNQRIIKQSMVWISLGTYVLISALASAEGRAPLGGMDFARTSRYTTTTVLFIVSIIQLLALFYQAYPNKPSWIYYSICGLIFAFVVNNSLVSLAPAIKFSQNMSQGKSCLESVTFNQGPVPEKCLERLYPNADQLTVFAYDLNQMGIRKFKFGTQEPLQSFIAQRRKSFTDKPTGVCGKNFSG